MKTIVTETATGSAKMFASFWHNVYRVFRWLTIMSWVVTKMLTVEFIRAVVTYVLMLRVMKSYPPQCVTF